MNNRTDKMMIEAWIDDKLVRVVEGSTILDGAIQAGVHIPTLCHLAGLQPLASCFLCVVKVEGRAGLVPACATKVEPGMRVETAGEEIIAARKTCLELLISDHAGDCIAPCQSICPARLDIPKMLRLVAQASSLRADGEVGATPKRRLLGGVGPKHPQDYLGVAPNVVSCDGHAGVPPAPQLEDAASLAREALVLPAVLGRICPAPCEKGCRRSQPVDAQSPHSRMGLPEITEVQSPREEAPAGRRGIDAQRGQSPCSRTGLPENPLEAGAADDGSVSIRACHRFLGDLPASAVPDNPNIKPSGKKVAIVGSGPAGLAAAMHLRLLGHACTIIEKRESLGGALRYALPPGLLPADVLDKDIASILSMGIDLQLSRCLGQDVMLDDLRRTFDAVVIAAGQLEQAEIEAWGLANGPHGIKVDRHSYQTSLPGVFAGGQSIRTQRLAVRAIADGKAMAASADRYLRGQKVAGPTRPFTCRMGHLNAGEMALLKASASAAPRQEPLLADGGLSTEQVAIEAARCLHCDCRKADDCRLRDACQQHDIDPNRFKSQRRAFEQDSDHPQVIYESGKCIACGLCIQIAGGMGERLGLTFVGRGFNVRVQPPLDAALRQALTASALACVQACPTGALAMKDD